MIVNLKPVSLPSINVPAWAHCINRDAELIMTPDNEKRQV